MSREKLAVPRRDLAPQPQDLVEALELPDAERRAHIVESVIEAEPDVLEPTAVVAASLITERPQCEPLLLRVRRDHPAFAGRDLLVRVEREHGARPVRADRRAFVRSAERFTGVLDEREPVLARDRAQLVELARIAEDVDRDDRLRPRGHCGLDRGRIHVQRLRVDVREHRHGTLVDEAVRARREGVRRRDHLVAGLEARGDAEQMQARGAGRDRRRVRRADGRCEELFEAVDRRAEREPPRPQHLEHELLLALTEERRRKRDPPHLLLHAWVFAAGAYSSHCAHRSVRPCTVSRYASWISSVTGPGGPMT